MEAATQSEQAAIVASAAAAAAKVAADAAAQAAVEVKNCCFKNKIKKRKDTADVCCTGC
jgi:hypothetical protein